MKTLLRAAYVYPVTQPLLRDAAVVFEAGRILAVGPADELLQQHPDAIVTDLGNQLLLPGLINPHTHLELSNCACDPPSASFTDWILSLPGRIGPARDFAAATRAGIAQSLRFGVTTVGDISQQSHLTRPILAAFPLRCVSYGEVLGLAKLKPRFDELLPRALDTTHHSDRLTIGLTPHAPYTVDLPGYRQCLQLAREHNLPLATHLAESPAEQPFLEHHAGPFRAVWNTLNSWADPVETFAGSPVRFATSIGLLDYPTLLAHVNYCDDAELSLLAAGGASVVYCPRTHAYFNHPPHRFCDMLAAGVNVAVGTDSCASSPDLNPMDDVRLVHRLYPALTPELLLTLITINAARALQLDSQIGSLARGKYADFASFPVTTDNPLIELLETRVIPTQTWIAGVSVP